MATVISNVKGKHNGGPDYHYTLAMTSERTSATSVKISSTLTVWLSEASDGSTYDGTDRIHCYVSAGTSTISMKNSSDTTIRPSGTTWRANNKTISYGTLVNSDHKKTIKINEFTVSGLGKTTTSLKTHLEVQKTNGSNGEYSGYGSNLTISAWPSYTITFNANGGTGAPSSQTKWKNEDLKLSSTKPTRTGYTFVNWYNSSRDVHYNPGGTVEYNGDQTLKAQWKINTYKITFNANGGTGGPTSATKTYGTTLTLPTSKPTKTGYTFLGWSTSSSATSATYSAGGSYTSNAAATLYAVWKINTYTITFNANGGTYGTASATKTYGVTLTLPSTVPTRQYFTFLGWSTSKTATTATYKAGGAYTTNAAATLYAIWKENNVTVSLKRFTSKTNYSSFEKVIHIGEKTTILVDNIANTYEFLGWSKEAIPQPLPYSTTRTFDKYVLVENENANKIRYGMYRDITPTLFKLKSSEIIRAAAVSQTENTFKDYYENPEAFKGEDEYGKRLLGYFELTGEKISKIDTKSIKFLLSPDIDIDKTKIQTYFSDINNRLFFDLPADIDSSTKYTLKINFNDDLGKPVTFSVISPFKQKIIDIYKESSSGEYGFEDEFRFKVNNHDSPIGTTLKAAGDNISLPSGFWTQVCSLKLSKGTWLIEIGARFTYTATSTNTAGIRVACVNFTPRPEPGGTGEVQFKIPGILNDTTQFRWSIVKTIKTTTSKNIYLHLYHDGGSNITSGSSGFNLDNSFDTCYGSFLCATRIL